MMGDNMNVDDMVMDLDLNQEPLDPPVAAASASPGTRMGLAPLLSQLETAHGRIEDRIRQLEAVTARARQRQRWRQARNNPETSYFPVEPGPEADVRREIIVDDGGSRDRAVETGRSCKRDSSHLVAKALEMDLDVKKDEGHGGGSFYDCNICLGMARDPILTCCGHLFCWACFYQLPYVDSSAKECPVCKGEVNDTGVTPIYGNGNTTGASDLESGVLVPPRPQARRIESVRQQRVSRGITHIPVAEALRRIRIGIGAIGEHPQQQGLDNVSNIGSSTASQVFLNAEAGSSRGLRSRQFTRVLSESAASLSSISSALNNAERLVEDLETYIHDRLLRRADAQFLPVEYVEPFINTDVTQAESLTVDSGTEVNYTLQQPSSSRTTVAGALFRFDNLTTEAAVDIDLTVPRSSSRRRSGISRESRRRRLR